MKGHSLIQIKPSPEIEFVKKPSCDISRRLNQPDISVEKLPNSLDFFDVIIDLE